MGLGAKSLTTCTMLLISSAIVWNLDLLRAERLRNLDPMVPFAIGVFATILGALFFHFWEFRSRSHYTFRIKRAKNQDEYDTILLKLRRVIISISDHPNQKQFEIYPKVQQLIYFLIFICVGLMTFNNRALNLIKTAPTQMSLTHSRFCFDTVPEEKERPDKFGCELVNRAFELGYAKSLGSCQDEDPKELETEVCRLRRQDEPYLHFAWRKVVHFWDWTKVIASKEYYHKIKIEFNAQLDHLNILYESQIQSMDGRPRSQHHIWTNLPHPDGQVISYLKSRFVPNDCLDRYATLPHSLTDRKTAEKDEDLSGSARLDHVLGHLLFSPRYKTMIGYCREYVIHWDSSYDACRKLSEAPTSFLKDSGSYDEIQAVFQRFQIRQSLSDLHKKIDLTKTELTETRQTLSPQAAISFQCIMTNRAASRSLFHSYNFSLLDHEFEATELSLPEETKERRIHVNLYKDFSQLLADGFHYTGFLSHAKIDPNQDGEALAEWFSHRSFMMARLEFLRNADIFLGHDWLQGRPDLLEVYPYHLHLYRFVNLFRQKYKKTRGRL